jgi:cytochrome c553
MKRLFASLVMGIALAAVPAVSAAQKAPAGKKSMEQNGRFHQFHAQKFAIECAKCHKPEQPEVVLQVPRDRLVDRQICFDCHKHLANSPSNLGWYSAEPR